MDPAIATPYMQDWQTRIHYLSEAVDVFSEWIDSTEAENTAAEASGELGGEGDDGAVGGGHGMHDRGAVHGGLRGVDHDTRGAAAEEDEDEDEDDLGAGLEDDDE